MQTDDDGVVISIGIYTIDILLYLKYCSYLLDKIINCLILSLYCDTVEDSSTTWSGSDRDYTYDELLSRVFEIILDKNPDMAAGRKPKFVMRPPQVLRVGTKKTSFANFTDICKTLHRWVWHTGWIIIEILSIF